MNKVIIEKINKIIRNREQIINFLVIGAVICGGLYIYNLHGAIENVVEREKIVRENRALSTSVSELEAKYFSLKNSINIELARRQGYKDSQISLFISKKSITALAPHNEL
ncbi:MAG TPA: hypothetical protein VJI66_02430 [Candidatus Paceibacterota bacterium]